MEVINILDFDIIMLIFVIVILVFSIFKQIMAPQEIVQAVLVSKKIIYSWGCCSKGPGPISAKYKLTFRLENDEILEFSVKLQDYAVILEGNVGQLTYKGRKYKGFYIENISEVEGEEE